MNRYPSKIFSLSIFLLGAILGGVVGCRSLEEAGNSLGRGLHETQRDIQDGLRGEDKEGDPLPTSSASPASSSSSSTQ